MGWGSPQPIHGFCLSVEESIFISEAIIVFIFGMLFGSFANVCVYRIPRKESIVFPASHCPACNSAIAWYDNIPVFSFLNLRAKCRSCQEPISWRYPAVELLTGLAAAALYWRFQLSHFFWLYALLTLVLIIVSVIDLREQIIPDELSYGLVIAGVLYSFFNSELFLKWLFYFPQFLNRFVASYLGLLAGGGALYLIGWLSGVILKRETMGGGDIKLAAGIGTFLGWENVLIMLYIAFILGGTVGLTLLLINRSKKKDLIPFGPFIALATFIVILFEPQIYALLSSYFTFY